MTLTRQRLLALMPVVAPAAELALTIWDVPVLDMIGRTASVMCTLDRSGNCAFRFCRSTRCADGKSVRGFCLSRTSLRRRRSDSRNPSRRRINSDRQMAGASACGAASPSAATAAPAQAARRYPYDSGTVVRSRSKAYNTLRFRRGLAYSPRLERSVYHEFQAARDRKSPKSRSRKRMSAMEEAVRELQELVKARSRSPIGWTEWSAR